MRFTRQITDPADADPFSGLGWKKVDIEINARDPAERVCLTDIEVPAHWSHQAATTFARYYIRRAGIPAQLTKVREKEVPAWLWRSVPDTAALQAMPEEARYGHETSARQVFLRLAGMWTYWGLKAGYFDTENDARVFHDEICALLARQVMAPNSPQWFNTGLYWAYGMTGPAQGHFVCDADSGKVKRSTNAYERPQLSACFIHGVDDDLVNEGGIMDLFEREARAFKYGSGSGANLSAIRGAGEELSGGAASLGLMRFLSIGDKAAGAIRAGGLPRRAGKMVVIDIDHPDVVEFVRWKGEEQYKVAALITGARAMRKHLGAVMLAIHQMPGEERFDLAQNPALKAAVSKARAAHIPTSAIERVIAYAREGYRELHIPIYTAEEGAEVFFTVGAHQTKQAVRVTHRFMIAAEDGEKYALRKRRDGGVHRQVRATELLDDLAHAVWTTGEPTIHFTDTIARANTCPNTGKILASTPASEYLFLDDTACPIAAINLLACADARGFLNIALLQHAVRISTTMLDISVTMAQYPSRAMARRTFDTRPIGVGVSNMAALLTRMGYAYGSDEACATTAAIAALVTGEACLLSTELAKELGEFNEFDKNREAILKFMASRRVLLEQHECDEEVAAETALYPINFESLPQPELHDAAKRAWEMAQVKAEAYGLRNAQLSCVPPTSTIARIMDCETLCLEPLASPVKFQTQAKGTSRKTLSANVVYGLGALGYTPKQIEDVARYACGHRSLKSSPVLSHDVLRSKIFGEAQIAAVEAALSDAVDIHAAFDPFILGEKFCRDVLDVPMQSLHDAQFSVLTHLGFTEEEIAEADAHACGHRTLDGAPHLAAEDGAVFTQHVTAEAQIAMLAAAQPFLTGGIAHKLVLPHAASVAQCQELIRLAWRAGLKSLTLMREASALYEEAALLDDGERTQAAEHLAFAQARVSLNGTSVSQIAAQLAQRFTMARRELPARRNGFTQKTSIGGHTIYLRSGEYQDGSLGEIFIDTPDEAESYRALVQQFGRAISVALQYGVPLSAFVAAFAHQQFQPSGAVEGSNVMEAADSLLDYIFRELDAAYGKTMAEAVQSEPKVVPLPRAVH